MATGSSDLGAQTGQMSEALDKLKDSAKYFEKIAESLEKMTGALNSVSQGSDKGIKRTESAVNGLANATNAAGEAADKAKNSQNSFNVSLKNSIDEAEEYQKRMEKVAKVAGMFGDALSGAASSTLGLIKAGGNLIGMLFNVGAAIVSIPFKLWDAFVEKSMNMPYNPAFRQMKEDVRETFGSLKSGAGKDVMDTYRNLRSEMGSMAKEAGLSMRKIFGFGVDGKAAMLGFIKEVGQGLGSQMGPILKQVGKDVGRVTYAIKGMGLSGEESGKAMSFFYNSGQNASKMLQDMGKTAAMMAKQTGFNIKTLSKAMVETTQAFPQFAKQGVKALAEVAHYTHNLGISVQSLKATYDAFDSFDAAAESASKLSQAFGINIDAMKMIKEQSPTKRMEMLRDAFKQTGKSLNELSTAERKHLLESMHISEEDAERVLGEGNKKKALSESEKAAQAATQAAKNQTKAMKELAESIKRIIPPQAEKFQGFFDAFSKGFSTGMFYSENMGKMMRNLQAVFRDAYYFGKQLAMVIFDNFPGMNKLAKGFAEFFDPVKFKKFFNEVIQAAKDFFKIAETDPQAGFRSFIDRVKALFAKYFGGSGTDSALGMIKEGFKQIVGVLGSIIAEALKMLMEMMTEGFNNFADMIRNPNKMSSKLGEAKSVGASFLNPIMKAIREAGPALWEAFKNLLDAVWEKLKPYLITAGKWLAGFFLTKTAVSFGTSLAGMLITEAIKKRIMASTQTALTSSIDRLNDTLNRGVGSGGLPGAGQTGGGIAGTAGISVTKIVAAGLVIAALGVLVYKYMVPFAQRLKEMMDATKGADNFIKMALGFAAVLLAIGLLAKIVAGGSGQTNVGKDLPGEGFLGKLKNLAGGISGGIVKDAAAMAANFLMLYAVMKMLISFAPELATAIQSFDGITTETMIAFAGAMVGVAAIVGVLGLVAAAMATLSKLAGVDPLSMAVAGAIIAAIGSLAMPAITNALNEMVKTLKAEFPKPDEAEKIARAVKMLSDAALNMSKSLAMLPLGFINIIGGGLKALRKVIVIMGEEFPTILKNIDETIKDATGLAPKVELYTKISQTVVQLAGVFANITQSAMFAAATGVNPDKLVTLLQEVSGMIKTVSAELSTFIKTVASSSAKDLNEKQIQSVAAIVSLTQVAIQMLGTALGPYDKTMDIVKILSDKWTGGNHSQKMEMIDNAENFLTNPQTGIAAMIQGLGGAFANFFGYLFQVFGKYHSIAENPEKMNAISKFLETATGLVHVLLNQLTQFTEKDEIAFREGGKKIDTSKFDMLGQVLKESQTHIDYFISSVFEIFVKISKNPYWSTFSDDDMKMFKSKMESLNEMIKIVPTMIELAKSLEEPGREIEIAGLKIPLPGKMLNFAERISGIVGALFPVGGGGIIALIAEKMTGTTFSKAQIENFKQLSEIIKSFSTLAEALKTMSSAEGIDSNKIASNISIVMGMFAAPGTRSAFGLSWIDKQGGPLYQLINFVTGSGIAASLKSAPFKSVTENIKNMSAFLTEINNIPTNDADKVGNNGKLVQLGQDIQDLANGIVYANETFKKGIKTNDGIVNLVKDIGKLGRIEVNHNIPGVQMNVTVNLSAEQIAKGIVNVDVSNDSHKVRRANYVDRGEDKTLG